MKKVGGMFVLLFLAIMLMNNVSATGVCDLDKFEYHPGETASFNCACSLPTEENAAGYIVWRNSTGAVLQNVSTNSGTCRSSIFGSTFLFPTGASYLGNATFETDDAQWVGETISDNFNVTGVHLTDCIIMDITGSSSIDVGGWGAVKFELEDGLTGEKIIHASCVADGYDVNGLPLVFEPSGAEHGGSKLTSANGEVGFTHQLTEDFWIINTTYKWEFHCYSLPNVTHTDVAHVAFLEDSGAAAGMKSCSAEKLFQTNGEDLREFSLVKTYIYFFLAILLTFLSVGFFYVTSKVDYDKWNEKIQKQHAGRNKIKAVLAAIGFNFAKESFMTMYVLFLPVVLIFRELTILVNADSILTIVNALSVIYGIGVLVVITLFFGKIQEFIADMVELTKNENWGIGETK